MRTERFRWLAGLIAAHPGRKLVGRTRLQKEMWLLQRLGMPSGYSFRMHYFGPYSEGVQAEVNLLERFHLVDEARGATRQEGGYYSVFTASHEADLPAMKQYQKQVDLLAAEDDVTVLELAATYDMCRSVGLPHNAALGFVRNKKHDKCFDSWEDRSAKLLRELGLQTS